MRIGIPAGNSGGPILSSFLGNASCAFCVRAYCVARYAPSALRGTRLARCAAALQAARDLRSASGAVLGGATAGVLLRIAPLGAIVRHRDIGKRGRCSRRAQGGDGKAECPAHEVDLLFCRRLLSSGCGFVTRPQSYQRTCRERSVFLREMVYAANDERGLNRESTARNCLEPLVNRVQVHGRRRAPEG